MESSSQMCHQKERGGESPPSSFSRLKQARWELSFFCVPEQGGGGYSPRSCPWASDGRVWPAATGQLDLLLCIRMQLFKTFQASDRKIQAAQFLWTLQDYLDAVGHYSLPPGKVHCRRVLEQKRQTKACLWLAKSWEAQSKNIALGLKLLRDYLKQGEAKVRER